MDVKGLLKSLVLKQGGKVVTGEPERDNFAVSPVKGSPSR